VPYSGLKGATVTPSQRFDMNKIWLMNVQPGWFVLRRRDLCAQQRNDLSPATIEAFGVFGYIRYRATHDSPLKMCGHINARFNNAPITYAC
jgi:hypothetical protein